MKKLISLLGALIMTCSYNGQALASVSAAESYSDEYINTHTTNMDSVILSTAQRYIGCDWLSFRWVWNNSEFIDYCAIFIDAVLQESGVPRSAFPHSPFVDNEEYNGFVNFFKAKGRFSYRDFTSDIRPKWLIVFDQNFDGKGDHIGFVYSKSGDIVTTIEGNSDDGKVCMKTYNINNPKIMGYCITDFDNSSVQTHTTATTTSNTTTSNITTTTVTTTEYIASAPVTTSTTTAYSELIISTTNAQNVTDIDIQNDKYYMASLIGGKMHSTDALTDSNVSKIIDTDTYLTVYSVNPITGLAYCITEFGDVGYIHTSLLAENGQDTYYSGCRASHYVWSGVGVRLRAGDSLSAPTLYILDDYTEITILSHGANGFVYAEVYLDDGSVLNGYIHDSLVFFI